MSARFTSGRRSMPLFEWPQADQAGWHLANQPQDLLDDSVGYAQRWRPATQKLTQDGYGYWLDWLARSGQLCFSSDPAGRATPECLRCYREGMEADGLASYTVAGRIQQVGRMLSAIAPDHDWAWMLRAASRLHSKATPTRDKRVGMQPAVDVEKLGFDMMHAAEHDRFRTKVERAVLFRDGLLLAMLVSRSVRRANITSIEIGCQLHRRGEDWWMQFTAGEMKSGCPFECSVPIELTSHLNRYIEVYRPTLLQCTRKAVSPTVALWISKQGTHMTSSAVYYQITTRTQEEFGKPINPHKFRSIYATDTATLTPSHAGSIQSGLGHAGPKVGEKYYNLAQMMHAGRRYDETIHTLRKEGRRTRVRRPSTCPRLDHP